MRALNAELQNKKCSQDTFFLVNKFGTGPDLSSEHMRFVNQGPGEPCQ